MISTKKRSQQLLLFGRAYFPSVAWAAIIFILSSFSTLPGVEVATGDFILKKLAHIGVYAILFLLLQYGQRQVNPGAQGSTSDWLNPLFYCAVYAFSDEIHQTFVPGRYGTLRDIGFDLLGSWLALLYSYRYI